MLMKNVFANRNTYYESFTQYYVLRYMTLKPHFLSQKSQKLKQYSTNKTKKAHND